MRIIDFGASFLGLIVLTPLMIIIPFLIKLETPGPVLFRQVRVGLKGKLFTCLKFRTMYVDTENRPSHEIATSSITKVGSVLRRTKLDEIPQLINVLVGHMALVGPRPCLPSQTELIEAREKGGAFNVLPGITGLAQINHIDMSEPERLARMDAFYAETRTIWGDIKIIFLTFAYIVKPKASANRIG